MTWTDIPGRFQAHVLPFWPPHRLRIRTKLLAVLIPCVVVILLITGYVTYVFSQQFLQTALERIGIVQTMALAKALEDALAQARRDLLFIAAEPPEPGAMARYLERVNALRATPYKEFAYIDLDGHNHVFFVAQRDRVLRVPDADIEKIRPSPFTLVEQDHDVPAGEARLGRLTHLDYHIAPPSGNDVAIATEVFRLYAPRVDASGRIRGMYILSLGARELRNILSLYQSTQSPLHGFERSPAIRYSFLFDTEGWVLFQSAETDAPQHELSTYLARSGYAGTLGRHGMESAFRPESSYKYYWKMINEVREGKSGIIDKAENTQQEFDDFSIFYMPYAPVRFQAAEDAAPRIIAGVASMDKSQMTLRAGYKQIDVVFIITLAATLAVTGLITLLARAITRPIIALSTSVTRIEISGELKPIQAPDHDHETTLLKNALNRMIEAISRQIGEIRVRDQKIEQVRMREQASLGPSSGETELLLFPEIKGTGPLLAQLKGDLAKAAQVDADVLITGETGTGKQLVAEAIHRHSRRASRPFISINCGALDENLLLDTLFGHVKGAFTEARADRKGAFLEAEGGILFLDEIQTATPKVQQALLRTIAMRLVRPLGSDKELAVNVRLIAASNVDLRGCIAQGTFREDLYFRLKVIAVSTPPLRLHKASIPHLVYHFLKQAGVAAQKPGLGLSRGALAKLAAYDWPGNIRELKHCILRAAVMCEQTIIQDTDILLEAEQSPAYAAGEVVLDTPEALAGIGDDAILPPAPPTGGEPDLNPRQRRVMAVIVREGSITRSRYQELEGKLPQRTAVHDLRDMVEKGLLVKRGSGPSTRYEPTEAGMLLGPRPGRTE